MTQFTSQIYFYLEAFRRGDADDAFHGLLEMDRDFPLELMEAYRSERHLEVREFLLQVIREYRDRSVVPLLQEALRDPQQRIWRQALDGLVALACPTALDALRASRARVFTDQREAEDFRRWLEEAIEQMESRAAGA